LTQRKIKFILDSVKNTKTFESLFERLIDCPVALFEAPPKVVGSSRVRDQEFIDEERIRLEPKRSETLVLQTQNETEELLQWTKTKLDFRKLPTYYLMLSKFRLSMLVGLPFKC
jgi:hypothetical protein